VRGRAPSFRTVRGCLESRPCSLRHVTRSHRAPSFGSVLVARYGSPKPGSRVQTPYWPANLFRCGLLASQQRCRTQPTLVRFLPPDPTHEPWGCRYPRWALNPKHAGSTPASCSSPATCPRGPGAKRRGNVAGRILRSRSSRMPSLFNVCRHRSAERALSTVCARRSRVRRPARCLPTYR
jgi:hypothetical protein